MRGSVSRDAANQHPELVWNAFVDLLAMAEYDDLSGVQCKAHLVFWYESGVQNGGHGQYLENQGCDRLEETRNALAELGLPCQANLVSRVMAALREAGAGDDWAKSLDDDLIMELDRAFGECKPSIIEALEQHLQVYRNDYVELV